ncbi:MAG: autotransporter-associated beta strand repeat-containing protein, partial [Tepidisphaeraceae bacterium]
MKKLHLRRHGVSRTARSAKAGFVLAVAAASGLFSRQASAQVTGTWTEGDTGAGELWTDSGNWLGGVIPGNDTGVTNNTDTAVFNGSPSSNVVNLNGNWNLQNILFDTANATNFAIGPTGVTTYSLLLTGGTGAESASQSITVNSTVDNGSDEIINAPIVIEGNSYAFIDKSTTSTAGLQISGNVSGGVAGTTNLYLDGANEISSSTGNSAIVSDISNGAATTLNLVMNGTGEWELRTTDTNTYTGSTTINSGTLRVTTTGALPTTTDVTVNGPTALFYLSATTFPTVHSLTLLNGGSAVQVNQSGSCGLYIANNTGTGFTWNATGLTSTVSDFRFQLDFTGTGAAGTGGLTFLNGPNTPTQKFGSANYGIDLGTVNRIFNIEQGGQSIAGQSFNSSDLQLYGLINDSGGITKTGAGILKFQNPSNDVPETFTGPIEIQQGTLRLIGADLANPLCGTNALLVDGGKLDINTANATFGAATFTSGSIVSGTVTNSSATIFAPSFTFNLASGVTFTSAASFGDGSSGVVRTGGPAWGTANLSLTGPGTLVMNGTNSTYSGGTTVNSGTLLVNAAGALPANEPVTVKGGVLRLATGVSGGSGPAVTSPIDLTSLSITGSGVLDINNDHLIITYGATDPITTIA